MWASPWSFIDDVLLIDRGSHQQQKEPVLVLEGPEEGAMDSSLCPPR